MAQGSLSSREPAAAADQPFAAAVLCLRVEALEGDRRGVSPKTHYPSAH
jgi:hypothetical protein